MAQKIVSNTRALFFNILGNTMHAHLVMKHAGFSYVRRKLSDEYVVFALHAVMHKIAGRAFIDANRRYARLAVPNIR